MELSWAKTIVSAEESGGFKSSQQQQVVKTLETPPTTAHIINHNLNVANRWYEIKLFRDLITWQIRCRSNQDIFYSYDPSHQTFMTLRAGEVLSADTSPNSDLNAIWVSCATSGVVAELEVWRK